MFAVVDAERKLGGRAEALPPKASIKMYAALSRSSLPEAKNERH
jgi:hypothetical protein